MIEIEEAEERQGAPAWMATFADLMSLLLSFFVLLLSFSEMDVEKYKQIAGSMAAAFGVQSKVKVADIPKGTSIIAQEFSPGKPRPTTIDTINQVAEETVKPSLRVGDPGSGMESLDAGQTEKLLEQKVQALLDETRADAEKLHEILEDEIRTGKVDIESQGRSITVRIKERGSFPSGSADLNEDFLPVMATLRDALAEIPGKIAVEGHTDDVPIAGIRFRSNWALSAGRALSVAHELLQGGKLGSERLMVVGYADTRPHKSNETLEGRAENRRVEIVIRQRLEDSSQQDLEAVREASSSAVDVLGLETD